MMPPTIIMYISNKNLSEEWVKEENLAVTGAAAAPVQKKTLKRSAQCHIFAQSPPGRRPNDKYPVNTSYHSDLCKNVSLR